MDKSANTVENRPADSAGEGGELKTLFTLADARKHDACEDGYVRFEAALRKAYPDAADLDAIQWSIGDVARVNLGDALWCLRMVKDARSRVRAIMPAVKRASKHTTDERVHWAINEIDRWLASDDTVDLMAARAAADAADAADAAAAAAAAADAARVSAAAARVSAAPAAAAGATCAAGAAADAAWAAAWAATAAAAAAAAARAAADAADAAAARAAAAWAEAADAADAARAARAADAAADAAWAARAAADAAADAARVSATARVSERKQQVADLIAMFPPTLEGAAS